MSPTTPPGRPAQVAAHLRELGAPAEDQQVVSSSQAAAELLASLLAPGRPGPDHRQPGAGAGDRTRGPDSRSAARTRIRWPWSRGSTPTIGWKDLAEAAYVVAAGALWVATNTDMSIPQARGIAPGNGTLVAAVAAATGQTPRVAGKPEAPLFHAAAKRLAADRPLVVGDRLDTDILGGNNAGFATVAVLTGVDTRETILAARTAERPDYIINSLTDLHRPYPAVDARRRHVPLRRRHRRVVSGDTVRVSGSQDDLDSWRAACAAWWAAVPGAAAAHGAQTRVAQIIRLVK